MRFFCLLFILLSFSSCYEVDRNCENFKAGSFTSEVLINNKAFTSTFTRTEHLQIETYEGKIDSSEVRWINDCEVIFKTINPKNRIERKDIHLKIIATTDTSYTFEYSYVGETQKQKGTATKLN